MPEVVKLLGYTGPRQKMLANFLAVRALLHEAGVQRGEQWLAGSFVERTAQTRSREPADIDLVTVFGEHEDDVYNGIVERIPQFQSPQAMKRRYDLDAYYFQLPSGGSADLGDLLFWSAFLSHTTQNVWKGYVRVELDPNWALDAEAVRLLNSPS